MAPSCAVLYTKPVARDTMEYWRCGPLRSNTLEGSALIARAAAVFAGAWNTRLGHSSHTIARFVAMHPTTFTAARSSS